MPRRPSAFRGVRIPIHADGPCAEKDQSKGANEFSRELLRKLYIRTPPGRGTERCPLRPGRILSGTQRETPALLRGLVSSCSREVLTRHKALELARGCRHRCVNGGEPVVAIGFGAAGEGEEFFLEAARDRARDAFADLDFIDRADGRDFDSRAAEEDFVDDVEHFAGDDTVPSREYSDLPRASRRRCA